MSLVRFSVAVSVVLLAAFTANAETTVTVTDTHLCCGACVTAVGKALEKLEGATAQCDREAKSITIKAKDDAVAKKALGALAKAGFHGKTDNEQLMIRPGLKDIPKGKVSRIELTGVHNCCGACTKAIKAAIASVDGCEADTVKAKESSFVVEGNFNARQLVRALNKSGFHASLKKEKEEKEKGKEEKQKAAA